MHCTCKVTRLCVESDIVLLHDGDGFLSSEFVLVLIYVNGRSHVDVRT